MSQPARSRSPKPARARAWLRRILSALAALYLLSAADVLLFGGYRIPLP